MTGSPLNNQQDNFNYYYKNINDCLSEKPRLIARINQLTRENEELRTQNQSLKSLLDKTFERLEAMPRNLIQPKDGEK